MSFSQNLKTSVILLVALGTIAMAKSTTGRVTDRVGDVKVQSAKTGKWEENIQVGARIRERDQISTGAESYVTVRLPDGTSITVQEQSLVQLDTLDSENGVQMAFTDVKTGKIKFEAQKQKNGGYLKFKTGVATAAIRGTVAFIGITPGGKAFVSASEGKIRTTHNKTGRECDVSAGQTLFFTKNNDNCNVVETQTSGDPSFVNELERILDNDSLSIEEITKSLKDADANLLQLLSKISTESACTFESLEDTVTVNKVSIKGSCPSGTTLQIAGASLKGTGNAFDIPAEWAPSADGDKKFPATCSIVAVTPCDKNNADKNSKKGKQKKPETCSKPLTFNCGELHTYYKAPVSPDTAVADTAVADTSVQDSSSTKSFSIKTASPVKVCDPGSVTIEGTFDPSDPEASLYVKLGNYTSRNLVPLSANGEFSHTVTINDIVGNWNVKKATVEYKGKSGNRSAHIELDIDKTCKQVNQGRPIVSFTSSDSLRCKATFMVSGAKSDIVLVESEIDGDLIKETTFMQDDPIKIKLKSGIHTYTFTAKDQADNRSTLQKKLSCHPQSNTSVEFTGGDFERLRVPPPPRGMSSTFVRNMHFRITNVHSLNPAHIRRLQVTQGNKSLLNISNGQITDLDYDVQVNLTRGETTKVTVTIDMKNGMKVVKSKTYEVR